MRILGIDPGYDRMGWSVVDREKLVTTLIDCGIILTPKDFSPAKRLAIIYEKLNEICEKYHPSVLAIESLFLFKNQKTVIGVAQSRGIVLLTAAQRDMEVQEFSPPQIKLAVTGNGHADKKAVEKMVRLIVKNVPEKLIDDTLDAIAVALTSPSQ